MADIETLKPDEAAVETPLKVEATVETPLKVEATVETPIKDEATVETPIKVEAAVDKNGSASCPDIETKIIRQVEHYFGDYNLTRDKFLLEKIKEDDGWISMEVMLKFQRLIKISTDVKLILESLKKSDSGLLEVDEEKLRIRRSPSKPLPEVDDATAAQAKLSVYVKGFEKEKTTLDDLLQFFEKYENVVNVFMRTYPDKKTKEKKFKGSVFVTFKDRESAEKFFALESVKNPEDEELIRKWSEDYNEEKKVEFEAKKRKIQDHKAGAKKVKELVEKKPEAKQEEEKLLPKGAVLKLENLSETSTRETLRDRLKEFGTEHTDIAFIYYSKGESTASLRFKEENAAKNLLEKINESLVKSEGDDDKQKLVVDGADVTVSVLEGEEEEAFLAKCLTDMAENRGRGGGGRGRGHKRRGGFQGGRGGKRQRN